MTLSRMAPRAALGALTLGAVFTLAAPLLPFSRVAQAGEEEETTTVTISTSKDREATVLKLEPMKPGETKTVPFRVAAKDLAWYDAERKAWRVDSTSYGVLVGPSSRASDLLKASFTVAAASAPPERPAAD